MHVYQALLQFISNYKIPENITSDDGTEFNSNIIKEFSKLYNINWHYTLPDNPNSNAIIERFHSTLIEHLRILTLTKQKSTPQEKLLYAIIGYNNSIHSNTKYKPIDLLLGHLDAKTTTDINKDSQSFNNIILEHKNSINKIYENLHTNMHNKKSNLIEKINKKRIDPPDIEPGSIAFKSLPKRQLKINEIFTPKHVLKSNGITITTPQNTYHKQSFKKPRKLKDSSFLQDSLDSPGSGNEN